jgi:hypothetical protein
MFILSNDIHPEDSLYYIGAKILEQLLKLDDEHDIISLYILISDDISTYNKKNKKQPLKAINFVNYILALNWLFLLNKIDYNHNNIYPNEIKKIKYYK